MFEIVHIGIPTTQSRENEKFIEEAGIYVTDPENDPFNIEYVRFLPNAIFPQEMQYDIHVAAKVDCIDDYVDKADSVIVPKMDNGDCYLCFIRKNMAIIELIEFK